MAALYLALDPVVAAIAGRVLMEAPAQFSTMDKRAGAGFIKCQFEAGALSALLSFSMTSGGLGFKASIRHFEKFTEAVKRRGFADAKRLCVADDLLRLVGHGDRIIIPVGLSSEGLTKPIEAGHASYLIDGGGMNFAMDNLELVVGLESPIDDGYCDGMHYDYCGIDDKVDDEYADALLMDEEGGDYEVEEEPPKKSRRRKTPITERRKGCRASGFGELWVYAF